LTDKNTNIIVELTEQQFTVLTRATELLFRVHLGQLEHIGYELEFRAPYEEKDTSITHIHQMQRQLLTDMLKSMNVLVTGFRSGSASLGISNKAVCEDARISYDLFQILRRQWLARHGKYEAEPYHESKQPFPTVISRKDWNKVIASQKKSNTENQGE
jgi:hypothetical protein